MKKVLITLFIVLILGFSIFGYSQTISKPVETIEQNDYSNTINFY